MNRPIPILLFAALALVIAPASALACAVCTGGGEESKTAFIVTTIGMSVLPLAMFGGLGWWIYRRVRAADTSRQASPASEHAARLPG